MDKTPVDSADLSKDSPFKKVYTYEEALVLIKQDRERLIEFIEGIMAYLIRGLADKVPIKLQ